MYNEVFYEDAKKCVEEYGLEYDDKTKDILERGYKVLQWRDKQPNKRITPTEFRKHMQFTLDSLQKINKYMPETSNMKLSKKCGYYLRQLDLYVDKSSTPNPKMERYFNQEFHNNEPSKNNILILIYTELSEYFGSHLPENFTPTILKDMISDIFNKGKPFRINAPKYRQITLTLSGQTIKLQSYRVHAYPTNREVEYTYSQNKI